MGGAFVGAPLVVLNCRDKSGEVLIFSVQLMECSDHFLDKVCGVVSLSHVRFRHVLYISTI
jgi:hypothetical protein